ncbi:hypothetical protein SAMN04487895_103339 [Paenibacillus sophorae]|uniref:Lipoprotein n=1 Tax=Paenibacillus sophorae TaxID=1333845 RepID=A0A1H8K8S5_9BACL|nr:hypothetical protein [Paenibacillus sophorae]QWU13655.1 hypothetical protein KP014_16860 [Paenibacillus sophorae]SEN89419.1 hypothetical protein SAMN04487895_103339 [Paenibacillus sophorae]
MKEKTAFFAILSLALATTAVTACASPSIAQKNTSTPEYSVAASQSVDTTIIIDKTWSDKANNRSANVTNTFRINSGFGHLKLLMVNYSSHPVKVSLTHLDTSKVYFARTIAAGESLDWRNFNEGFAQGMRTGNYLLQWIGSNYNVNGEVRGSAATEPEGLLDVLEKKGARHR